MTFEPSDEELLQAEQEMAQILEEDDGLDLEDLFQEAQLAKRTKPSKGKIDSGAKTASPSDTIRALYNNPENWETTRVVALVDKETKTLIGNFEEHVHKKVLNTRRLVRLHGPASVAAVEEIDGYLGAQAELEIRNNNWDEQFTVIADLLLEELQVDCPTVEVKVFTRFCATVRIELISDTQFASPSGNTILCLAAGTDVLAACSTDTKISIFNSIKEQRG